MDTGQNPILDQMFDNGGRGKPYHSQYSRNSSTRTTDTLTVRIPSSCDDKGSHQTSRFLVDNATSTLPRRTDDRAPDATATEDPRTNLRKLLDFASELKNVDLDSGLNEYKMMMEGRDPKKLTDEEMYAKNRAGIASSTSSLSGEMQSAIDRLRTERDRFREEANKLREELESEKQKYTGFSDEKLRKLETENKKLNDDLAQERGASKELKENVKKAYGELQVKHMGDEQLYKDEIEKLKQSLKSKGDELRQREKEKAEALNRLSKEMGNKLNNKNPNIADLSDSNRPTKIAEKYNELYDNEWTDAMEILISKSMSEEVVIRHLLEILQACYKFCQDLSRKQMNNLYKELSEPYSNHSSSIYPQMENVPPDIERLLIECRKTTGVISVDYLYNEYIRQSTRQRYARYVQEYVKKCLEVCWLMLLQDPPVVLSEACRVGDTFETTLYKAYTKSGDKVSFTVWLPLLLHAEGPLLAKGVVQPFPTESSGSDRRAKSAPASSTRHRGDSSSNPYGTAEQNTARRNADRETSPDYGGEKRSEWAEHKPEQHSETWLAQSYPAKDHIDVAKRDTYNHGTEYDKRTSVSHQHNPHFKQPMATPHNVTSSTRSHSGYTQPTVHNINGIQYIKFMGQWFTPQQWYYYEQRLLSDTTTSSSTA